MRNSFQFLVKHTPIMKAVSVIHAAILFGALATDLGVEWTTLDFHNAYTCVALVFSSSLL